MLANVWVDILEHDYFNNYSILKCMNCRENCQKPWVVPRESRVYCLANRILSKQNNLIYIIQQPLQATFVIAMFSSSTQRVSIFSILCLVIVKYVYLLIG